MPRTESVRAVGPCAERLGCVIELHHTPETAADSAEPFGMLLLIECDFGLNVHGILPSFWNAGAETHTPAIRITR
jgi:hypothetical protein